ncbi:MAG: hypothetical protein QXD55_01025 [Candidatus Aenigmatarchaeota archaeon]
MSDYLGFAIYTAIATSAEFAICKWMISRAMKEYEYKKKENNLKF